MATTLHTSLNPSTILTPPSSSRRPRTPVRSASSKSLRTPSGGPRIRRYSMSESPRASPPPATLLTNLTIPLLSLAPLFHHLHNILYNVSALLLVTVKAILRQTLFLVRVAFTFLSAFVRQCWNRTEKFRDRLFYDFLILMFNPYALVLIIFWPGWIVVGLVWWLFLAP